MTTATDHRAHAIEARAREVMAIRARLKLSHATRKQRADMLAKINLLLDLYNQEDQ